MLKINNKKLKNIKKFFKKLPLIIAKHAFLVSLALFLLSLLLGVGLFYKYSILVQKTELGILEQAYVFEQDIYEQVLEVWQEHERISQQADIKEYLDPFLID